MASSVWRGQLTFGLVSFPVRLQIAARRERVRMHYLRRAPKPEPVDEEPEAEEPLNARGERSVAQGPSDAEAPAPPVTRIKQEFLAQTDQRPVPRQELLRGYEVAPEQYVTFSNEELRKLRPTTSPDMQILRSVRLSEIDPVYFETSYYVVPDKGGERAYALLFAALEKTEYVAIAKVAMHGREHILVVRPGHKGLLAHTMFYNDEIREGNEFQTNTSEVTAKELELATKFVEAIADPFAPEEFKDTYREQVQNLISSKVEQKQVAASAGATARAAAPVVNILDALKKSLENTKKPAKTEVQSPRRAPGKVTELKSRVPKRKAR
jgi:DNA end-binding protein Ku